MASQQTLLWVDIHNFVPLCQVLEPDGSVWFERFMKAYYDRLGQDPPGAHNRTLSVVGDGLLFLFHQRIIDRGRRNWEAMRERDRHASVAAAIQHFITLTARFTALMETPGPHTTWAGVVDRGCKEARVRRFRLELVGGLHVGPYEEIPFRGGRSWVAHAGSGINLACRLVELDKRFKTGGLFITQDAYDCIEAEWKRQLAAKSLGHVQLRGAGRMEVRLFKPPRRPGTRRRL